MSRLAAGVVVTRILREIIRRGVSDGGRKRDREEPRVR